MTGDQKVLGGSDEISLRLLVLWTRPADEAAFEADYRSAHMPLVERLPGIAHCASSRIRSKRFFRVAELEFRSLEALNQAMSSPAGIKLSADAQRLAGEHGVESISLIALAPDISVAPLQEGPSLDTHQD